MGGHGAAGPLTTTTFILACCLAVLSVVGGSLVDNTAQQVSKTTTNRQRQDLPSSGHHRRHQKQQQQHQQHHPLALPLATALSMLITAPNASEDADNSSSAAYFVTPLLNHVTTRAGQAATLTCIVKQLGSRQVSWIRGRDLHVLSSGQVTFSSDSRISVSHVKDSWTLTIRYTQPRDAGSYSCQVNTQPLIASWYNLTVVEARANILGKETMYVQSGSTVTLECVIKEELVIPGLVLWYQDDRLVDRDSRRVKVVTQVANVTTSTLTVTTAAQQDSGNYSCWPSSGRPDSVLVHVIQGEPPAAMQHGNSAAWVSTLLLVPATLTSLLFLLT
ncbi:zwei Ig domain protein zig-8-like [Homarus americanus]|uniref:zwei Ig domain protein zig-8-like n=1 Tax=Homarus americanus TaxID=6706 RepID=UPI001C438A31|nr:zwei Ig domain protein zig-8-like [Homarus americanus]XP_042210688.1 zwei Ig domain protein zig-8-like [Homarus americanus]